MSLFRLKDLMIFYRQLATMINSGMDVIGSMDFMSEQMRKSKLAGVVSQIRQYLLDGESLSQALAKFPRHFPQEHVYIIKYGETGGTLSTSLERISNYLEKNYDIQKRLITGLAYPFFLLHFAVFALPIPTLFTRGGNYLVEVLKVLIPLYSLFFLFFLLKKALCFPRVKKAHDSVALAVPVFGSLIKKSVLMRFIFALKCLYDSGVGIIQSWNIAADVCDNSVIKEKLLKGAPVIEKGDRLSQAFVQTGLFSHSTLGIISTGEKSGSIGQMLGKVADYYEKEYELLLGLIARLLPVIIYITVVFYVGFRIIVFYMGYFSRVMPTY